MLTLLFIEAKIYILFDPSKIRREEQNIFLVTCQRYNIYDHLTARTLLRWKIKYAAKMAAVQGNLEIDHVTPTLVEKRARDTDLVK